MTPPATPLPLRDIHLPEAVSWWPPAPGWWILLALAGTLLLLGWRWRKHLRNTRLRRAGLRRLNRMHAEYQRTGDLQRLAQQLSALLRRIALSRFPRHEVAALTGDDWLAFLDDALRRDGHRDGFRGKPGRLLIEAPYNPAYRDDPAQLLQLSRHWITRMGDRGQGLP